MTRTLPIRTFALAAVFLLCTVASAAAQRRDTTQIRGAAQDSARIRELLEERFGRGFSNQELLERLRRSGLTRAQIRARLQQLGYDPGLADDYFDIIEGRGGQLGGNASREFVEALARVGLTTPAFPDIFADSILPDSVLAALLRGDTLAADTLDADALRRRGEIEVFGLEFFRQGTGVFEPTVAGPVDPGYRLGPGDELVLVITGDVEAAYDLQVSPEGLIVIPDVGQVSVNGLTLAQLQDVLYNRLGRVYSGISRETNATTRFVVSTGRLRMNQIFLTGEVDRPGSYQVSAAGTAFNALYRAGGPTEEGTFRNVTVSRAGGGSVVVDLYDYLIYGDGRSDVRIEHNDRIFVPPAGPQVRLEGSVKRAAIYEIRETEGLRAVLAFAGGLDADAVVSRIQIDRILPPDERQPGRVRVVRDVDIGQLYQTETEVPLQDGDVITVFAVSADVRNRVWVTGEVRQPGKYEWFPGATLDQVIARAEGVTERAYEPRIHIYRLNEQNNTRNLVRVPLEGINGGSGVPLVDGDSVVVLSREELTSPQTVTIEGYVKEPGEYTLAAGMTLEDLILAARGFELGAYVLEAEVSRMPNPLERTDTTARIVRIPLDAPVAVFEDGADGARIPVWAPDSAEFVLHNGDRVFIRKAPGYDDPREVAITGEVLLPGRYILETRDERFSDLIARVGGLTSQAYPAGMHVVREGRVIAADLFRAFQNPTERANILLEAGDSIHVPAFDPTVVVSGAVTFNARVLHRPGAGLSYYINQAGGYADAADKSRVTVTYLNGERAAVSSFLLMDRAPRIEPGSVVHVPAKAEAQGFNWDSFLTRTLAVMSTVATVILAVTQLN
jgi:protein involved in polysaccharide export with SLBB domain